MKPSKPKKTVFEAISERFKYGSLTLEEKSERLERYRNHKYITLAEYFELVPYLRENKPTGPVSVGGCEGEQ